MSRVRPRFPSKDSFGIRALPFRIRSEIGEILGHAVPSRVLPFVAWLLLIAACRCGYGHTRPVIVSGRDFPCRSAISLEGEPSPVEVIALIGNPLERRPLEGGEVFRYSVRGHYGDRVKLFGLITISKPHYFWSCDVRFEFRGGRLYSITHTKESDGPSWSSAPSGSFTSLYIDSIDVSRARSARLRTRSIHSVPLR